MTEEEKRLLLQDLVARLPYGVKYKDARGYKVTLDIWSPEFHTALNTILYDGKPSLYLRPMSSMTEAEHTEYMNYVAGENDEIAKFRNATIFYNMHHFDYNGLIEKGLALPAPDGMYNEQNN